MRRNELVRVSDEHLEAVRESSNVGLVGSVEAGNCSERVSLVKNGK
jgi:hypothetical protein